MQNKPSKWVSGYKHGPAASYTQITRMGLFLNVATSKFEPLDSTWDNLHSGGMFISDDNKIYFRDETNKDIYINSPADNQITIGATSGVGINCTPGFPFQVIATGSDTAGTGAVAIGNSTTSYENTVFRIDGSGNSNFNIDQQMSGVWTSRLGFTRTSGDVTVGLGNLVIGTAGKGIDFSVQTATATGTTTSELLDHYEEGTWVPAWVASGTAPTTLSYLHQEGYYTRIGRQVTCTFRIGINTFTAGSISGDLLLSGLPFTAKNVTNAGSGGTGVLSYAYNLNSSYDWPRTLWANDNAATAYVSAYDTAGANNSSLKDLTDNIILSLASSSHFMGEITYFV